MAADLTARLFERAVRMKIDEALPALSGLSAERIEAIRSGDGYTASEYERMCRALAVDPVAMYRGDETDPGRSPARFRTAVSVTEPTGHDLRLLALAAEAGAVLAHIAEQLGRYSPILSRREVRAIDADPARQGYELGAAARLLLSGHDQPLDDFTRALNAWGVHIARVPFSSSAIDAASLWAPGTLPIILVNRESPRSAHPGALRAVLAHELCHLLHDAGEQDITTIVSWGVRGRGNYAEAIEVRARAFAPAFIAPPAAVQRWAGAAAFESDEALVTALATHWGLSFEGAAWHAKNCRLIDHATAKRFADSPSKPSIDYATEEPASTEFAESTTPLWRGLASQLIESAVAKGHISPGRAEELLSWG